MRCDIKVLIIQYIQTTFRALGLWKGSRTWPQVSKDSQFQEGPERDADSTGSALYQRQPRVCRSHKKCPIQPAYVCAISPACFQTGRSPQEEHVALRGWSPHIPSSALLRRKEYYYRRSSERYDLVLSSIKLAKPVCEIASCCLQLMMNKWNNSSPQLPCLKESGSHNNMSYFSCFGVWFVDFPLVKGLLSLGA